MTAPSSIDPAEFLHEHLVQASPDLMRQMLATFINTLLSADADAVCGAGWGQVSDARLTQRNGYRHRDLDTRTGTLDVAIPKLRSGTYFPEWLLERRRASRSRRPRRRNSRRTARTGATMSLRPLSQHALELNSRRPAPGEVDA